MRKTSNSRLRWAPPKISLMYFITYFPPACEIQNSYPMYKHPAKRWQTSTRNDFARPQIDSLSAGGGNGKLPLLLGAAPDPGDAQPNEAIENHAKPQVNQCAQV